MAKEEKVKKAAAAQKKKRSKSCDCSSMLGLNPGDAAIVFSADGLYVHTPMVDPVENHTLLASAIAVMLKEPSLEFQKLIIEQIEEMGRAIDKMGEDAK